MKSTEAGQAVDSDNLGPPLARDWATAAETSWAPKAVSDTPENPSRRKAAIICSGRMSANSLTQDGARET